MCNCGKKRADLNSQNPSNTENVIPTAGRSYPANIKFQYTGNSSLTITGNITGRKYHFSYPGDVQEVNSNDVNFMAAVPGLKKYNRF